MNELNSFDILLNVFFFSLDSYKKSLKVNKWKQEFNELENKTLFFCYLKFYKI